MHTTMKWLTVGALAATGMLAFACGGGSSEGGGSTTPSASAPATTSAAPTQSAAVMTTATATPTAVPAPPLVVVAMKMSGPKMKGSLDIKDDGSIVGPDGKSVAKIVGAELQDKDGKMLIAVAADGTVKFQGAQHGAKFNEKDELVVDNGAKFWIADDGSVNLIDEKGQKDKDSGKLKLTGFKPTARRAGLVIVLGMLMPSSESPVVTSAVTSKK